MPKVGSKNSYPKSLKSYVNNYKLDKENKEIFIGTIGHRKNIYDREL